MSPSAAERAVRRYVPHLLRADQWEPIAEFTVVLALQLNPANPKRAIESMRTISQSSTGRGRRDSLLMWS
ncbi:hypothetical protein GCM10023153_20840 [Ornithinibacter aureus]|uniref:Uncharacterized protein n=1 Tax=Ornithinibacter aureus TaxID=622664 RepID=A0ABP8JXK1_9MICO|nr:hypothetical protein [Ornithinibacter aureus]